jgi:hypothetical protein
LVLAVGAVLFAAPAHTAGLWPWPLTPLTAQAVAAWLLGLGVVLAGVLYENDWLRIRPATAAYMTLGLLQFVALARYHHALRWSRPAAWIYVAILATVLGAGVYGWLEATCRAGTS